MSHTTNSNMAEISSAAGFFLSQPLLAWLVLQLFILMSFRSASGTGCENEGPCGADRYCSMPNTIWDRCRHCDDIAHHYCHDREVVLAKFPTCDAYCFKLKVNNLTRELEEKKHISNQTQLIDGPQNIIAADGVQLDWLHYVFMALFVVALVWAVAATLSLRLAKRKDRTKNAVPVDRRELEQLVPEPGTNGTMTTPPPVTEEGYETGVTDSATSTPRCQTRTLTPPPDQVDSGYSIPCLHQTTDFGNAVNMPTTEDTGPKALAL